VNLVDVQTTRKGEDWLEDNFEDGQETRDELDDASEDLREKITVQTCLVSKREGLLVN